MQRYIFQRLLLLPVLLLGVSMLSFGLVRALPVVRVAGGGSCVGVAQIRLHITG